MTVKRDTTSLKINPVLWKQAKIEAINHEISLSDLIEQSIDLWIKHNK